ncbi:MAG: hypothetical protein ACREV3_05025 [Gammaproteobacteria bacterium]
MMIRDLDAIFKPKGNRADWCEQNFLLRGRTAEPGVEEQKQE